MPQTIQRSFTGGELSPSLQSRADTAKYSNGLNLCKDFIIRAQGGVYSRPGFRYIGPQKDHTKKGRLIPFSFNTEQTYMLVFEDLVVRVIKDGGYVLKPAATVSGVTQANPAVVTTGTHTFVTGETVTISGVVGMTELNGNSYVITVLSPTTFSLDGVDSTAYTPYSSGGSAQSDGIYELVTPYTEAELPRLGYTQSADVMTIVHPSHDDANLNRLADDNWTLVANNYASTVTAPVISSVAAGGTGAGTYDKSYTYVVTAVDANGVESLASASSSITTKSLSTTAYNRITWGAVTGAEYYRVYKDPSYGTDVYGWIGDSNNLTFDDFNIAPITSDAPPEDRQPFTGAGNKPSVVGYFQQRRIFANTNNEPQTTFTTQVANFNSLRTSKPARDDDAVTFTIAAQQVNEIRHLLSLDALLVLTSGGEWIVSEGQDEVLTPSTVGVRPQSYNGASWTKPVIINSTVLYVQEKGARIRDLGYQFSSDKYTGNDLSIMSEHLFEGYQINEMAYAAEPYSILWCVRDDGVLLGLTYQREHEVWGWHQHSTDGEFESVATVTEDNRDAVYVIVKRTVNGSVVRYIERLEKREQTVAEDCFYVDSGLSYNGVTATITGATQADPVVITAVAHPFVNGDSVRIENVVGMTELNDNVYVVANAAANTFELTSTDGTAFTAYASGGTALKVITTVSGADHLEAKDVVILADGVVVEDKTITSGSVTLDEPANKIHIGLQYIPAIELLDLDVQSAKETLKAKDVSVSEVYIEVEQSRGGWVGGRVDLTSGTDMLFQEIKPRFESDCYGVIPLRTFKMEVIIDPQWSKGGGVRIEQRSPLPLSILSVIPEVDVGDS